MSKQSAGSMVLVWQWLQHCLYVLSTNTHNIFTAQAKLKCCRTEAVFLQPTNVVRQAYPHTQLTARSRKEQGCTAVEPYECTVQATKEAEHRDRLAELRARGDAARERAASEQELIVTSRLRREQADKCAPAALGPLPMQLGVL